jgi:hypothetical protein
MQVRVAIVDDEVMIGFKCENEYKAKELAYDIVQQMKAGELRLTLQDVRTTHETEH